MTRVNVYRLTMVKESAKNYDLEKKITRPEEAAKAINEIFDLQNMASEVFAIICLNTKGKIAGAHIISQGSLNSTVVHPREVFKAAVLNNAASVLLFHNHPSGDATPSSEDIETTKRLISAGVILGIIVNDHVIIGDGNYVSLRGEGLI